MLAINQRKHTDTRDWSLVTAQNERSPEFGQHGTVDRRYWKKGPGPLHRPHSDPVP